MDSSHVLGPNTLETGACATPIAWHMVPEKTGWPSWWNYAREGSGGSERSPNCWRVQSYPGGRGGVRISRPPAVCRACLELLLQGAEAEPTYHAGAEISGRAAVSSSVSNLSPCSLFGLAREPDRRAEDALGDTLLLAPEAEGKPGLTHPRGASPRARPAPRMWGAGTGPAPKRPGLRPGLRVQRGWVPRCALVRGLSLACCSSVDSGPAEAPEPAPPGCSSSSSSSGPRPPLPVSFPNQLPNRRAGVGRSRLCSSPPLSQVEVRGQLCEVSFSISTFTWVLGIALKSSVFFPYTRLAVEKDGGCVSGIPGGRPGSEAPPLWSPETSRMNTRERVEAPD
ncbi:uncharacterized protein LOC113836763 [Cricetulus griseus]|uniref:Uncharacterized protein LOC113836763 n=1 Tax=Cricetulus griseus TaxID=10029 RepID=A0A9J7KBY7_CRIGR|nr:uncharacterized protein LOC113836763 [Cricetulus griseus]